MAADCCLSSLNNDDYFKDHLSSWCGHITVKKVWNNSTDPSSWDCIPYTICTPDQKSPSRISTSERIMRSICLACDLMQMICESVQCKRFCLIDQYLKWYVPRAGWGYRRNWNLCVTDWIGNQSLCMPFCYDTKYTSKWSITHCLVITERKKIKNVWIKRWLSNGHILFSAAR